jgi:hypothetical protein
VIELRRSRVSSGGTSSLSSVTGSTEILVVVAATAGSSEQDALGLPELALRLSKAPNIPFLLAVGLPGDPMGGELLPSEIPP